MAKGYRHLTYGSRCQIYALRKSGMSIRGVARSLGVSASTVSRELRRNCGLRGYRMKQAQRLSAARRRLASSRPRKLTAELWGWIEGKLRLNWSPQQIAGRLRLEGGPSVGKTWIYRQVWKDRADGGTLHRHLRRRGKKANRRGRRGAGRGVIPGRVDIAERPAVVELKRRVGDWELDTIVGARHRGALVSVVDRCSKFAFLRRVPRKTSSAVGGAVLACLRPFSALAPHHDGGQRQGVRGPPGGCRGLVGGLFLRPAVPFLGARAEASTPTAWSGSIFRRRRSSPAWTMPGWNGCSTFSMAVRAGFWATARRRKCLARPWTRPDFPARSQSLRRWRGRTRRRGRLDRPGDPVRGLRRRRRGWPCPWGRPTLQPDRDGGENELRAAPFSVRATPSLRKAPPEPHRMLCCPRTQERNRRLAGVALRSGSRGIFVQILVGVINDGFEYVRPGQFDP